MPVPNPGTVVPFRVTFRRSVLLSGPIRVLNPNVMAVPGWMTAFQKFGMFLTVYWFPLWPMSWAFQIWVTSKSDENVTIHPLIGVVPVFLIVRLVVSPVPQKL